LSQVSYIVSMFIIKEIFGKLRKEGIASSRIEIMAIVW
jgi:hypothetical protein